MKIHDSANSIAAIYQRAGAENYFSFLKSKWINRNYILQVATTIDSIVHSNTIGND